MGNEDGKLPSLRFGLSCRYALHPRYAQTIALLFVQLFRRILLFPTANREESGPVEPELKKSEF